MSTLREYLFVDIRRIHSYYEQITSPKKRLIAEKAASWEISAQIANLGIKGTEHVVFRDPTTLEMLSAVETFILRSDYNLCSVPKLPMFCENNVALNSNLFSKHVYSASKAIILPSKELSVPGVGRLCLWLPTPDNSHFEIFLIEACPETDEEYIESYSGYTALNYILGSLTGYDEGFDSIFTQKPLQGREHEGSDFNVNPADFLKKHNVPISKPRKITTLFKWRGSFFNSDYDKHRIIGYPLYVAIE